MLAECDLKIKDLTAELTISRLMLEKLQHQLSKNRAKNFGASLECLDQLNLSLEANEIGQAEAMALLAPAATRWCRKDSPIMGRHRSRRCNQMKARFGLPSS